MSALEDRRKGAVSAWLKSPSLHAYAATKTAWDYIAALEERVRELEGQRCGTCEREPRCRIAFEAKTAPYPDFCCNRWTARLAPDPEEGK